MQRESLLGGELALGERHLRFLAAIGERHCYECLSIVRVRRVPDEGVGKDEGRIDCAEFAVQLEEVSFRRLHRDPIATAEARLELDAGDRKALRPPPAGELLRVRDRLPNG